MLDEFINAKFKTDSVFFQRVTTIEHATKHYENWQWKSHKEHGWY
jgi:hypothetical protein